MSEPVPTLVSIVCQVASFSESLYCTRYVTPACVENENVKFPPLIAGWKQPAITTHLKGNHAITTEQWRYIRYADGSEELYDEKNDPNEWTNLASKEEMATVKKELAAYIPTKNADPVAERAQPQQRRGARQAQPARRNQPDDDND